MQNVTLIAYAKNLSDNELKLHGQHIHNAMLGNSNFSNPSPTLAQLQSVIIDLNTAIINQRPGDKASTSVVQAAMAELKRYLKALAAYVQFTANNDAAIALSSGFSLKQSFVRTAQNFNAKQGNLSGTVKLETEAGNRVAYIWEISPDPIDTWKIAAITTKSKVVIKDLTPGKKYWFRVAIVNNKGTQPYSEVHMVHVV